MDKQEYRTKIDEAQKLVQEGDKEDAFYILDGMNWRKVHNVNALLAASEIYEGEQRYAQARELLELAHERSPIGRMIIYRLALLCIRLESYDEAKEYYDEFVEIAPHDSLQYLIQYQLAKAQGAEDITLISILEELKERDFLEEWAYELALLYHKTGQVEKCISTCDEIILWYGDGPYVENALELKMIYQPLDETQESKYKRFRSGRDGVTEVHPGEEFGGNGEILSHPIEIPEVALSNDRFNTQNLQAEIKRNIEEIMQATETGTVSENMEAIKELVEDIPYAKVPRDPTGPLEEVSIKKEEARRIDDTLRTHFREYLEEEYDGQISFTVPDNAEIEPQIAGQMTIEQIMNDWQRTARAAEQALSEADELRLENAKAKAIEEANQIIARLEEAKRELDAGVAPRDLLRNEYLADIPTQGEELAKRFTALKEQLGGKPAGDSGNTAPSSGGTSNDRPAAGGLVGGKVNNAPDMTQMGVPQDTTFLPTGARVTAETIRILEEEGAEAALRKYATKRIDKTARDAEREALKNQSTFKFPKIEATTGQVEGVGFEVPIVNAAGEPMPERAQQPGPNAAQVMADVNDVLQKEIDRARETGPLPKPESLADGRMRDKAAQIPSEQTQAFAEAVVRILNEQARRAEAEGKVSPVPAASTGNLIKSGSKESEKAEVPIPPQEHPAEAEDSSETLPDIKLIDPAEPELEAVVGIEEEAADKADTKEPIAETEAAIDEVPAVLDTPGKEDAPEVDDSDEADDIDEIDDVEDDIDFAEDDAIDDTIDSQSADGIYADQPTELTDEEREMFTYFTPISGMEAALCQVLNGARAKLQSEGKTVTGNIIVQGGEGSGKTTLATSLISVLQYEIGKPEGSVGRIDGDKLNTKDLAKLFDKIRGGCLIIERAGDITRDTALELSAQMEQDRSGILVILEDARIGIERVMALNPMFSRRFTEKVVIPVLTIDELVNFGKAYAMELGYSIDEMGVLAMYDRINLLQRSDHPTNLTEVKEIVDEAIDIAEGGGIRGFLGRFGGRHFDQDGNLILQEKDFQGR